MRVKTDVFNINNRACKVYRNTCDSDSVKYVIVQGVDREWLGRENVNAGISPEHVQAIDSEQFSNSASESDNVRFLDREAGKIMEKMGTGIVFVWGESIAQKLGFLMITIIVCIRLHLSTEKREECKVRLLWTR